MLRNHKQSNELFEKVLVGFKKTFVDQHAVTETTHQSELYKVKLVVLAGKCDV